MDQSVETTLAVKVRPDVKPSEPEKKHMPRWKVLLHNDDVNEMLFVCQAIYTLTPLTEQEAIERMIEAHKEGLALLLTTHQELAELYQDQLQSKGLTVTIEPEEED